jgi:hypothetical protein
MSRVSQSHIPDESFNREAQRTQITAAEFVENYAKMLEKREVTGPIDFLRKVIRNFSMFPNYDTADFTMHLHTAMLQIVNDIITKSKPNELVKIAYDSDAECRKMSNVGALVTCIVPPTMPPAGEEACGETPDTGESTFGQEFIACNKVFASRESTFSQEFVKSIAYEFSSYMSLEMWRRVTSIPVKQKIMEVVIQFGVCALSIFIIAVASESCSGVRKDKNYDADPILKARAEQLLAKLKTLPLHAKQINGLCKMIMNTIEVGGNFALSTGGINDILQKYRADL